MKIDIITLFPEMFEGPFSSSIVKRAQEKGLVEISTHDLRNWGLGKRKTVDDRPYGGGCGMVLMIEPIYKALRVLKPKPDNKTRIILPTPRGKVFDQNSANRLAKYKHLIFVSAHYEGYDERVSKYVDEEISLGNFVLTGGEIPTMAMVDSIVRLIPKVLEKENAIQIESFQKKTINDDLYIEYPQYTRPENFKGQKVPEVLLKGNHKEIEKFRDEKSKERRKVLG